MTYKASLKVHFDTEWTPTYGGSGLYDDEILPEEHYTFEIPCQDINSTQLFRFFGTVARTMGHNEVTIMKGACALAFNDMQDQENMRIVANEYDLFLAEDYGNKVIPLENKIYALESEVRNLKAKLSRYENPDNPNYTEEEMEAMNAEAEVV
jgi:hypothetical protein